MLMSLWLLAITALAAAEVDDVVRSPQMEQWYREGGNFGDVQRCNGADCGLLKRDTSQSFDYSSEKVYGLNVGGWLVTEPYITPSLYENAISSNETDDDVPVDEYHYCKKLGRDECEKRLQDHWYTFVNESDFQQIAGWGFNAVRITIGYWAFARRASDPFCFGQEEYLDEAIEWCRSSGLHMWISFHGMPGSQNGFDNSGLRDQVNWLNVTSNYNLGLETLYYVMHKYGSEEYEDVISGITNVNEPLGTKISKKRLLKFNKASYSQLRSMSDTGFVFHDAFLGAGYWDDVFGPNCSISSGTNFTITSSNLTDGVNSTYYSGKVKNVIVDHHRYEVFGTSLLGVSIEDHVNALKDYTELIVDNETVTNRVVGEWSAAMTDCAKWLNGVGRGSRYEGEYDTNTVFGTCTYSNDYSKMTEQNKTDTRKLIEAQLDLFNETTGFFFWTYKTEDAIEWDVRALIEHDLFPQPLTDRKYPDILDTDTDSGTKSGSPRSLQPMAVLWNLLLTFVTLCIV